MYKRQVLAEKYSFTNEPVHLLGFSMGGSFATHAAALPDAPWKSLTVIASFGSLEKVIDSQAPDFIEEQLCNRIASRGGIHPSKVVPEELAERVKIPLLQLHGVEDQLIPIEQARDYHARFGSLEKEFVEIPDAGHDNVLVTPMEVYAHMVRFVLSVGE